MRAWSFACEYFGIWIHIYIGFALHFGYRFWDGYALVWVGLDMDWVWVWDTVMRKVGEDVDGDGDEEKAEDGKTNKKGDGGLRLGW
jgi:hypothetical protein